MRLAGAKGSGKQEGESQLLHAGGSGWTPEFLLEGSTGFVHMVQAQYPHGLQLDVAGEIA